MEDRAEQERILATLIRRGGAGRRAAFEVRGWMLECGGLDYVAAWVEWTAGQARVREVLAGALAARGAGREERSLGFVVHLLREARRLRRSEAAAALRLARLARVVVEALVDEASDLACASSWAGSRVAEAGFPDNVFVLADFQPAAPARAPRYPFTALDLLRLRTYVLLGELYHAAGEAQARTMATEAQKVLADLSEELGQLEGCPAGARRWAVAELHVLEALLLVDDGRPRQALELLAGGQACFEAEGQGQRLGEVRGLLARLSYGLGEFEAAVAQGRGALDLLESPAEAAPVRWILACSLAGQGRCLEAAALVRERLDLDHPRDKARCRWILGRAAFVEGRLAEATSCLEAALQGFILAGEPMDYIPAALELAEVLLHTESRDRLRSLSGEVSDYAISQKVPHHWLAALSPFVTAARDGHLDKALLDAVRQPFRGPGHFLP